MSCAITLGPYCGLKVSTCSRSLFHLLDGANLSSAAIMSIDPARQWTNIQLKVKKGMQNSQMSLDSLLKGIHLVPGVKHSPCSACVMNLAFVLAHSSITF